jgi:hypothetical protein
MPHIHFLADENLPSAVTDYLRARGHTVDAVGDAFAKGSPDALLLSAAELFGLVVMTFDKDFKRLIQQVPIGGRGQFNRRAGRISLSCREHEAPGRIQELIEVIELAHELANRQDKRLVMQISLTSYTVAV